MALFQFLRQPLVDIEMQKSEPGCALDKPLEPNDESRMSALQALFGFNSAQVEDVRCLPITMSWCRYLEKSFEPLLSEQYAEIWSVMGLPRPEIPFDCWSLVQAVLRAIIELDDSGYSIEDLWKKALSSPKAGEAILEAGNAAMIASTRDKSLVAVFAVLCWGSMILRPRLEYSAPAARRLGTYQLSDEQGLKMDFCRRPILAVFRNLQKTLSREESIRQLATTESNSLFVSTVNYHSLQTIGKLKLEWVDNLNRHLHLDPRTRTLSVFRFPSFCALSTIKGKRDTVFEELIQALVSTGDEHKKEFECSLQLCQEVLMSYRVLFGQTSAARKLARNLLRKEEARDDYDQMLDYLCAESHKKVVAKLPGCLWPISCCDFAGALLQVDSYSLRDDFPLLGSRLATIQEFSLRQQPSRLRDLWRDRRNPLQWYTFWVVTIFGILALIVSILQLIVAIIAIPAQSN